MSLIANARMYAVNPSTAAAWTKLFEYIAQRSGIVIEIIPHAAPAPLEDLWRRNDLGLCFICGYPFASGAFGVQPVAVPVPASGDGRPHYATHLVVRADSNIMTLQGSFGRRLGWTVAHSQSGFNALRTHLLRHRHDRDMLYAASIGPLLTPRRVIDAVLAGEIDIGPLDSYVHDLLLATEPGTARQLRIVDTTAPRPIPLLAASRSTDQKTVSALKSALVNSSDNPVGLEILGRLCLAGFAEALPDAYSILAREAKAADQAGYFLPG